MNASISTTSMLQNSYIGIECAVLLPRPMSMTYIYIYIHAYILCYIYTTINSWNNRSFSPHYISSLFLLRHSHAQCRESDIKIHSLSQPQILRVSGGREVSRALIVLRFSLMTPSAQFSRWITLTWNSIHSLAAFWYCSVTGRQSDRRPMRGLSGQLSLDPEAIKRRCAVERSPRIFLPGSLQRPPTLVECWAGGPNIQPALCGRCEPGPAVPRASFCLDYADHVSQTRSSTARDPRSIPQSSKVERGFFRRFFLSAVGSVAMYRAGEGERVFFKCCANNFSGAQIELLCGSNDRLFSTFIPLCRWSVRRYLPSIGKLI